MWTILGAPLDSAGRGRGEELAPETLRRAGIVEAIAGRDAGDIAFPLRPAERDARTGIIAFDSLVSASKQVADAVAMELASGARPFVLGGDCTVLIGALAGCRRNGDLDALWFVDGHADYFDGESSPTGEAADMDLAIVTGDGPEELTQLGGPGALIEPARVALLGHRAASLDREVAAERARVPSALRQLDAPAILEAGPGRVGAETAAGGGGGSAWLHLDLDVLDGEVLPAVSYPQAEGLDWAALGELLEPLLASPSLIGLSLADFNPDRDPDGTHGARIVTALGAWLAG